jgi:DNA ligase 1
MLLHELAETSRAVAGTQSRLEKVARLAACFQKLPPALVAVGVSYLAGELPQGKLGVGYAVLRDLRGGPAAAAPSLDLGEVDRGFSAIKSEAGCWSGPPRSSRTCFPGW